MLSFLQMQVLSISTKTLMVKSTNTQRFPNPTFWKAISTNPRRHNPLKVIWLNNFQKLKNIPWHNLTTQLFKIKHLTFLMTLKMLHNQLEYSKTTLITINFTEYITEMNPTTRKTLNRLWNTKVRKMIIKSSRPKKNKT